MGNNAQPVDPTENVKDVLAAAVLRQDDLRKAERRLVRSELAHVRAMVELQAEHARELREAEAKRIDAIRALDVADAETLRQQVAATAAAAEQKLVATIAPLQIAIEDLRKAQYQTQGERQQVVDRRGASAGVYAMWGFVITVVLAAMAVVGFIAAGSP